MSDSPRPSRGLDEALEDVYEELKVVARRHLRNERANHTLQATALVNEAYLRMAKDRGFDPADRTLFFSVAANRLRQILVDHARARRAQKRGGDWERLELHTQDFEENASSLDLLDLDEAMKRLAEKNERQAKVVELRVFGGLSIDEIAMALNVSDRTVKADWVVARARLSKMLEGHEDNADE